MAQQIEEAHLTPSRSTSQADPFQDEHDQLHALCERLEAAAAALLRLRGKLLAQASQCRGGDQDRQHDGTEVGGPDPDGGRR